MGNEGDNPQKRRTERKLPNRQDLVTHLAEAIREGTFTNLEQAVDTILTIGQDYTDKKIADLRKELTAHRKSQSHQVEYSRKTFGGTTS